MLDIMLAAAAAAVPYLKLRFYPSTLSL